MRRWEWKFTAGIAVLAICAVWLLSRPSLPERELGKTQRALRREGFKVGLSEFDWSLSPELARRAALLARTTRAELTNRMHPDPILGEMRDFPPPLMVVGAKSAAATWQMDDLKGSNGEGVWPQLQEVLNASEQRLQKARQAAVSGPIRFEPIGSGSPNALLPYLADLKNLAGVFGVATTVALHDRKQDAAWTNLLAATCLATSYSPEPIEVSHLVRFACMGIASDVTWSALQAPGWTEVQLVELQRRWESLDLWGGLPETAAYSRACAAGLFQMERHEPIFGGAPWLESVRHPRDTWAEFARYWARARYRRQGSYEDEQAVLLYYRDREFELRRAIQATRWADMRQLPGVTDAAPFVSTNSSSSLAMMNSRQLTLTFQRRGVGLLGRAAEAEVRRRLVITALALERYRTRHGRYPGRLADLVPELLKAALVDFMDGQPLRYEPTEDGRFLLYSVGLDCVDNHGEARRSDMHGIAFGDSPQDFGFKDGTDLVWQLPASTAELRQFQEERKHDEEARQRQLENAQAEAWWDITSRRQSNVENALMEQPGARMREPVHAGRRVSEILWNGVGTNGPSLVKLLTLKQVASGAEPETIAFELPVRYDALTNVGELMLCIDRYGPDHEEGWVVGHYDCLRADNGNCRLVWSTIYETPGKHAILAALDLKDEEENGEDLFGPPMAVVLTNICQFTPESAQFKPDLGAKFYARLPESNATYRVELKTADGERLRSFEGVTSNGFFQIHWDLMDEQGRRCTNASYDSVFQITLPDSGRSQTLKGP